MSHPQILIPTEPVMTPEKHVIAEVRIKVHADETMSIEGPMHDPRWMLEALEHAKDAVRAQVRRREQLIIPAKDVTLPMIPKERQR